MPFYHTPSPLRGTPSILEGEFKTSNIQTLPTNIGEVTTKQTVEYDWNFDTASLLWKIPVTCKSQENSFSCRFGQGCICHSGGGSR